MKLTHQIIYREWKILESGISDAEGHLQNGPTAFRRSKRFTRGQPEIGRCPEARPGSHNIIPFSRMCSGQ